jgi:multiple sugar transport system substrate-binding protein
MPLSCPSFLVFGRGSGRGFHRALLCLLAYLLLGGCSRQDDSERKGTPTEPITLRVIGEGYPPLLALEQSKEAFERATGIRVEIVKRDHMSLVAEMDREFSSGKVSYDLVVMPHRLLGKFAEKGYVHPIDNFLRDSTLFDRSAFDPETDLPSRWWREVSWYGDRPYGFPFMILSMYTWYRKDLFENPAEQAGFQARYGYPLRPPATWREYEQMAEFFHRPAQGLYGTQIQGQRHIALWYEWLAYANGFGAKILDSDQGSRYGDVVVNSPVALRATEFYLRMRRFSSPDAANHNWDDALSNFQQGRVALAIMWHDSAPWVEDTAESAIAGKVGYAPPPAETGRPAIQLEGHTFLIPARARHSREAFRLMAWALSHDAQVAQTLAGGLPPRLSAYDDPRVRAIPYLAAFRGMLDSAVAVPKPTVPESDQLSETMMLELSRMVGGEFAPQAGLDRIATAAGQILEGKAALRYPPANR